MTTITTRSGKGSALTHQELDDNFSNLNSTKLETSGNVSQTGNVAVTGQVSAAVVSATGNVTAGNVLTAGQVSATANVTGGNITTAGVISATGNITGAYIFGNGSQLTGITGGGNATPAGSANSIQFNNGGVFGGISDSFHYTANGITEISKVKFSSTAAGGGSGELVVPGTAGYVSVVGNIIGGNISSAGVISAAGNVDIGGNLNMSGRMFDTSGVFQINSVGNIVLVPTGSTQITGDVSGTGNITGANLVSTGGIFATGGASLTGTIYSATALSTGGPISAVGNITGAYLFGNGSQLTGIAGGSGSPGGSDSQIQYNNGGAFGGNAAMTFNDTTGVITLGNVTVSNLALNTATANFDTANTSQFQTSVPWRMTMGNLYNGVANTIYSGAFAGNVLARMSPRLLVSDLINCGNTNQSPAQFGTQTWYVAQANITNFNNRYTGTRTETMYGGGSAGNTYSTGAVFGMTAQSSQVYVGAGTNSNLSLVGNTVSTSGAFTGSFSGVQVNLYSGANTAIGYLSQVTSNYANSTAFGNATNQINYYGIFGGAPANANVVTCTNATAFYVPGTNTTVNIFGTASTQGNIARSATNYHAFRNDDDLAKSRLGMLDRFHELNANSATTSGSVTIDKTNGQVQTIYPTAAITSMAFTNFVPRVQKPDLTYVNTSDTVTLIIQQGATPYAVTMPTGNTQIRYAGGISTVTATANTTTMISVTAVYDYGAAATEYLVTISPEFS